MNYDPNAMILSQFARNIAGLKPKSVRTMTNTELKTEWSSLVRWTDRKRDIEQELTYRGIRV